MHKYYAEEFIERDLQYSTFENMVILPLKADKSLKYGLGGCITHDNRYYCGSDLPQKYGGFYEYQSLQQKNETIAYCGMLNLYWGYFLLESIATLWIALERNIRVDKFVFIVNENQSVVLSNYKNIYDIFELLGITEKIELVNIPTRYSKVLIPERGYQAGIAYGLQHNKLLDTVIYRALTLNKQEPKHNKVLLSRSHFPKAVYTEMGLEIMDALFEQNGFEIIYPEEKTVRELICIFHDADEIISYSGTIAHNLMLCEKGKKCTIIERQPYVNKFQIEIDRMRNLQVTYIDANYIPLPSYLYNGPFMYGYTKQLLNYLSDHHLDVKEEPRYQENIPIYLRKYFDIHLETYKYSWGIESETAIDLSGIYEAYLDTLGDLEIYLNGEKSSQLEHSAIWHLKKALHLIIKH